MDIIIAGVGGQGTILTGRVLGCYAKLTSKDCKLSEVHGMSQRGGSVVTHFRMGERVYSPVIREGGADCVLAFELLEAARVLHFLKPDGTILINDTQIPPLPCIIGAAKYPDNLHEIVSAANAVYLPANDLAAGLGSVKAVNVVLLGALCRFGFDYDTMRAAIEQTVSPRFLQLNLSALELGYNFKN